MTVYVDDAIHRWHGKLWCHLFSTDIAELHAFAESIDLKRCWFQRPPKASWRHYDITSAKREVALRYGAVDAGRRTPLRWKGAEVAFITNGGTPEQWNTFHGARLERLSVAAEIARITAQRNPL